VSGRGAARTGRGRLTRLAGLLALLVGMLLLQSSLGEGPVADAAPCIESCEWVVHAEHHHGDHHGEQSTEDTAVTAVRQVPADHQNLVELSLTVLVAMLVALAGSTRPRVPAAAVAPADPESPPVRLSRARAGRPCVLRQ